MEVVRFYALDPGPELLAKYSSNIDGGLEALQKLVSPVMATITSEEQAYAILNERIVEMDKRLSKNGFSRLPLLDSYDSDESAVRSYDVCFNPKDFSTTYIVWKIEPVHDDPDYKYQKKLESKIIVGAVVH